MVFALKCCCLAVLFFLGTGVDAVAHERLSSPAFDPLAGFETRRLPVNQRYLQNPLEQIVVFAAGVFGLAAYASDGSGMRAVLATTPSGSPSASNSRSAIIEAPRCAGSERRGWRSA